MLHEGDVEEDMASKLKLVLETLAPYCTEDSEHEVFRKIAAAIAGGDELVGENLDGSTNFSYRVYPKGNRDDSVFVKVAFDYARWSPEKSFYDLERITTEYKMLEKFSNLLKPSAPMAKPYLCVDIGSQIRVLVAQWAPSHEVWGNQFREGKVDIRIIRKLARCIARVNTEAFEDAHLNDGIKDSFRGLYPIAKGAYDRIVGAEGEPADHFVAYARELGQERFYEIIDGLATAYDRTDVLLHGDTHAINILVEPYSEDGSFGEKGEFFICDWEMVHVGDKGRDPGTFFAWPILCAYFLAARDKKEKAYQIFKAIKEFWDVYATSLIENESNYKEDVVTVLRSCLGWCGVYMFIANYLVGVQRNYMPFDLVSKESSDLCLASVAITGVKCLERGFLDVEPSLAVEQLWRWFEDLVAEQIEFIANKCL